jgi:hypothetical protein
MLQRLVDPVDQLARILRPGLLRRASPPPRPVRASRGGGRQPDRRYVSSVVGRSVGYSRAIATLWLCYSSARAACLVDLEYPPLPLLVLGLRGPRQAAPTTGFATLQTAILSGPVPARPGGLRDAAGAVEELELDEGLEGRVELLAIGPRQGLEGVLEGDPLAIGPAGVADGDVGQDGRRAAPANGPDDPRVAQEPNVMIRDREAVGPHGVTPFG